MDRCRKGLLPAEPVFRNHADVTTPGKRLGYRGKNPGTTILPASSKIDNHGGKRSFPAAGAVEIQGQAPALGLVHMGELQVPFPHNPLMHIGLYPGPVGILSEHRCIRNEEGQQQG